MKDFTEQSLYLWFENYNEYKEYYKKKRIMETGVLNSDFIKKHLQRETELENKIEELEKKLNKESDVLSILNDPNDLREHLLMKLASCMSVSLHDNHYGIGTLNYYNAPVYDVSISATLSEAEFNLLQKLNESLRSSYEKDYNFFKDSSNLAQMYRYE